MRCRNCKYDILYLTEHRCPECGTPCDPDNSDVFDPSRRVSRLMVALVVIIACLIVLAFVSSKLQA